MNGYDSGKKQKTGDTEKIFIFKEERVISRSQEEQKSKNGNKEKPTIEKDNDTFDFID